MTALGDWRHRVENNLLKNRYQRLIITLSASILVFSMAAAIIGGEAVIFPIAITAVCAILMLIIKSEWLFFTYMGLFIFSELGIGDVMSIQISISNAIIILTITNIIIYTIGSQGAFLKPLFYKKNWRLLSLMSILLLLEIISAIYNDSYRAILTRVSHLVSFLLVFLYVTNKKKLFAGFYLGMLSVGILSLLTILRGLDLISFGMRLAASNYGTSPWEAYIPRSIGMPNMLGGLHGVYIMAFLPFAFAVATNGKKIELGLSARLAAWAIVFLGISAILISAYRSAWLGLIVGFLCLFMLYYRIRFNTLRQVAFWMMMFLALGYGALLAGETGVNSFYDLIFNVRKLGVDSRLIQYQFAFDKIIAPSIHAVLGYGYENFGATFMAYVNNAGLLSVNPELYPWLHNYHLAVLYADGWPGFIMYLLILYNFFSFAYEKTRIYNDDMTRMIASSAFSSLAGILVIISFSGDISGLHIIWVLVASVASLDYLLAVEKNT
jgi:hypothetical protein